MEQSWSGKVGNVKQLGGIETSVLDNGAGAGVRIAWIDTGSGLRYKVVLDRGMDIAEAVYMDCNLAWISHVGVIKPQLLANQDANWLRTFGGGLLTTCGLDHVGGPEEDEFGKRGVHGQLSNVPAEIIQVKQPDLLTGDLSMSITGVMRQHQIFGPCLTLKRTIRGVLGDPALIIEDEIINEANTPSPLMLLYHFNFGYPLLDKGTEIRWEGTSTSPSAQKYLPTGDLKIVPDPLENHQGSGEAVIFIDPMPVTDEVCRCGIWNKARAIGVEISWNKSELPCLTNWQHFGLNEFVTGLEPGTNFPIGQKQARANGELLFLKPTERKKVTIELRVIKQI